VGLCERKVRSVMAMKTAILTGPDVTWTYWSLPTFRENLLSIFRVQELYCALKLEHWVLLKVGRGLQDNFRHPSRE
jgi:hypothetical protein